MSNQSNPDKLLGQVLHNVIKQYVNYDNIDIIENFNNCWGRYKSWKLAYEIGDDWTMLNEIGLALIRSFIESYKKQEITPYLNENKMFFMNNNGVVITRQPDFIGLRDGKTVIVDFKFGRKWTQEMVDTSMQLTEYAMMVEQVLNEKPPISVAVCNLDKDDCQVYWIYSYRTKEQIEEFRNFYLKNKDIILFESVLS